MHLNKGIEKLSRDLNVEGLLEMVRGYHVMKQVLFSQDDRFLLRLQRRDVITDSSSAGEDTEGLKTSDLAVRDRKSRKMDGIL